MEEVLRGTLEQMTETQKKFICDEYGMTIEDLEEATEEVLDEVYDMLCVIEIEESVDDGDYSDRGKLASDLVTLMGNAIAESMGYFDEESQEG